MIIKANLRYLGCNQIKYLKDYYYFLMKSSNSREVVTLEYEIRVRAHLTTPSPINCSTYDT